MLAWEGGDEGEAACVLRKTTPFFLLASLMRGVCTLVCGAYRSRASARKASPMNSTRLRAGLGLGSEGAAGRRMRGAAHWASPETTRKSRATSLPACAASEIWRACHAPGAWV